MSITIDAGRGEMRALSRKTAKVDGGEEPLQKAKRPRAVGTQLTEDQKTVAARQVETIRTLAQKAPAVRAVEKKKKRGREIYISIAMGDCCRD